MERMRGVKRLVMLVVVGAKHASPLQKNKKRLAKIYEAQNQDSTESDARCIKQRKSRKQGAFSGQSNQTRNEPYSFFYPDCYCRLWNYTRSCVLSKVEVRSWAIPPIGNYTLPRRFV